MQAITLLLLRFTTGTYLIIFGVLKFNAVQAADLSDRYYGGVISDPTISLGIGSLQLVLGAMVVLGLFRTYAYWGQVIWYATGIVPIIKYILDPLAMYLVEEPGRLSFFPSTTLIVASLVMIAFREFDTLSLDHKRGKA